MALTTMCVHALDVVYATFANSTGSKMPIPPKRAGKESRCCSDLDIGPPKTEGQNLFEPNDHEMQCALVN